MLYVRFENQTALMQFYLFALCVHMVAWLDGTPSLQNVQELRILQYYTLAHFSWTRVELTSLAFEIRDVDFSLTQERNKLTHLPCCQMTGQCRLCCVV